MLEPQEIVKRIHKKYGFTHWESAPNKKKRWIYGVWYCSTAFQKAIYHGQFPATFVKRIITAFPTNEFDFLHLCCGRCHIEGATNIDIMNLPEVDIIANAEALSLKDESYDICLIDPPYTLEDSKKYGVPRLISCRKTMAELYRILKPGGWLLWLDVKYPTFKKTQWDLQGLVSIVTGINRRVRILTMFRKHKQEQLL